LTFKTLKNSSFEINFDSFDISVTEIKQAIENHKGYVKDNIRLFFNGSLLDNKHTLLDYGVHDENVLIVVNLNPPKLLENIEFEEDKQGANIVQYIESLVGEEEEINVLEEEKEEGINEPDNLLENIASIVKVMTSSNTNTVDVQNIISTLNENHPEMIDLITENEQEFKNLISQPVTQEDINLYKKFLGEDVEEENNNDDENREEENQQEHIPESVNVDEQNDEQNGESVVEQNNNEETEINLSKIDYDAVQRLKFLGFNEIDACQAYFAFDKNEELAAEFLYETKLNDNDDVFINYDNINQSEKNCKNCNEEENK